MLKTRLITDYINSLIGQEFVQGENDCNLIACKIIDILAGTDLYNSLYKKYSTKEEGLKICKELSGYILWLCAPGPSRPFRSCTNHCESGCRLPLQRRC